jgi:hypothetical protein
MTVPDDFTGGFTNPPPPPYTGQAQGSWGAQHGYGQQPHVAPMYSGNPQNGLGIAAFVLGILAILLGILLIGGVLGVVAIGLGFAGRGRVRQGLATNRGVATAGIVLGFLGFLLSVLTVAALVIGGLKLWHSQPAQDFRQCISSHQSDQAACEKKFGINPTPAVNS